MPQCPAEQHAIAVFSAFLADSAQQSFPSPPQHFPWPEDAPADFSFFILHFAPLPAQQDIASVLSLLTASWCAQHDCASLPSIFWQQGHFALVSDGAVAAAFWLGVGFELF